MMSHLIESPVGDGGEWAFAVDLFDMYGLLPQALYPESFSSSNSAKMDTLVDSKLREYCFELRKLYNHTKSIVLAQSRVPDESKAVQAAISACRTLKNEQLGEIYRVLCMCLGAPPSPSKKFRYEFYDKNNKAQSLELTPRELFQSLQGAGFRADDSFSIVHHPNHPLDKLYTIDRFQNVYGGRKLLYVNTEISNLEKTVIKMIQADEPVWFACDSRMMGDRDEGLWDTELRDYESTFGFKLGMTKAERLDSGDSYPSHAMLITGVHLDKKGMPVRYKIENSWGDSVGTKGYFVCTASWFREYVYEVIVPKKLAPPGTLAILQAGEPSVIPPWSTMRKRPSMGM